MRDALSLTDQAIAFGGGQLQEVSVRQMLGSVDRSYVFRLIEALAQGDGRTVVETAEVLRLNGLSAGSTLEEMSTVLQRMAVLQALAQSDGKTLAASPDDADPEAFDTARLATMLPADETQLLYSICLHGRSDLGMAPDEYAALTMVLLRLLAFKPQGQGKKVADSGSGTLAEKKTLNSALPAAATDVVKVQPWEDAPSVPTAVVVADVPPGQVLQVRNTVPTVEVHAETKPPAEQDFEGNKALAPVDIALAATKLVAVPVRMQVENRADSTAAQAVPVLIPTEEGDFWHGTVQQLIAAEAITAMVRELALQSQLIARDTDQWILRVERESLNQPGSRDRLASALQAVGHVVKLVVEVGRVSDSPGRRNNAASAEKQLAAEKIIFDDPFVQAMMRDFGAKIVPGSIRPL
jgi:DNA polymerase-3 subunit gamma/tau